MAMDQNSIVTPMAAVTATAAAHSGPDVIKSSQAYNNALVLISGLTGETFALQLSPDGVNFAAPSGQTAVGNGIYYLNLTGAVAYKFVKSAGVENATVIHSVSRYT
jgi:hypothetical protein